ncbi:MAG: URC4/urg3 family protein [Stappiaceae bacterium]
MISDAVERLGETGDTRKILNAAAVRDRAHMLLEAGLSDDLKHFSLNLEALEPTAERVLEITKKAYPDLQIPFHARWRHFETGGIDRWTMIGAARRWSELRQMGRAAFDLVIASVLLDAGAGADWRYEEEVSGQTYRRSEGLAVASVGMFMSGYFSGDPMDPFRCDAGTLSLLTAKEVASGFQVGPNNPMIGLEGRAGLLRKLGDVCTLREDLFASEDDARPGGLFDVLFNEASEQDGMLAAPRILEVVLEALGPIWPGRVKLNDVNLGDTWLHSGIEIDDATRGLMPLHKLSQWLSYSLMEPLVWSGVRVLEVDGLTGLAEYRNGGLFIDSGVLSLKNKDQLMQSHEIGSELVVEWRALTVALLDRIADIVRKKLDVDEQQLPLACVLEGGTWAAGRQIAQEKRADGGPPLSLVSDGTVF